MSEEIPEIQIVVTAMSLGPCTEKDILQEIGKPVTPESKQRVIDALQFNQFTKHGAFWSR